MQTNSDTVFETERLILRRWRSSDAEPFAAMNADPRVMRYFPNVLTREQSDHALMRLESEFEESRFGRFALELKSENRWIGFVGLMIPNFPAHFTPCVEIGWRLVADVWNRGLATEGARQVLQHAFEDLRLEEIVSFTAIQNIPSRRVMEKIGMKWNPRDDFDHPLLAGGHELQRHVLYRMTQADWLISKV